MDTVTALKVVRPYLAGLAALGLLAGIIAKVAGRDAGAAAVWVAATLPVLLALLVEIVTSLRRGEVGLDIVAGLSMAAALTFGENLAAAIVALMYAGGQYLEAYAEKTARREMTALLSRVPRTAIRHHDGQLEEVAVDVVSPGERLLIRRGDVVPVDGTVAEGVGVLDQSALTGESLPVTAMPGEPVLSGSTNAGEAFEMIATRPAAESTYAGIVRLVEDAQRSRAPMSRLADRYALVFLVLTVVLAGAAWWFSGDPIRAVAVLVVATPCPLILAVPVAIISGLSRAAKFGILIKGGKAIETLARVRTVVIDKTGTLTIGQAKLIAMHVDAGVSANEVLRIAASLDQASKHVIAQTLVDEARNKGLQLAVPTDVVETPGEGVVGRVDGRSVAVGGLRFLAGKIARSDASTLPQDRPPGALAVAVGIDGRLAGVLILADEVRAGTTAMLSELRAMGIERIVLATGDRHEVASFVASGLSLDLVRSELTPDQKILVVLAERKNGPVMMIGDGVNDAPALAAADVGVAMGAKGAAASAQAADVVLLVDQLDRILPAIRIARRSRLIALQSVIAGIGLSALAMVAASFGLLVPAEGAVIQEVIDVAVIFNALRALRG
ncbi:MAG TPA: heavy metal translocating P-type ATPase [Pseudolabrys sp.]|jgi:heavy metal translocating P-type ATPase|nr:heavy metal translocating P-type ATPase [Pseudolabrys sp.]